MAYINLDGIGDKLRSGRKIRLGGRFGVRTVDKKTGEPKEDWSYSHNVVTNEGLNKLLNVFLSTHTKISAWYIGLKSTTHVNSSATYAAKVFTESTKYSETVRQAWTENGSTAQSIDNSTSVATFSMNAASTADGAFLCSSTDKGSSTDTGAVLFAHANFASAKVLSSGDSLQVTYTFTAADAT